MTDSSVYFYQHDNLQMYLCIYTLLNIDLATRLCLGISEYDNNVYGTE